MNSTNTLQTSVRKLRAKWTISAEQDLKQIYGIPYMSITDDPNALIVLPLKEYKRLLKLVKDKTQLHHVILGKNVCTILKDKSVLVLRIDYNDKHEILSSMNEVKEKYFAELL